MTKQELRPFWLGLSAGAMMAVLAAASFFASSETVLRSSFTTALTRTAAAPQAREVAEKKNLFSHIRTTVPSP